MIYFADSMFLQWYLEETLINQKKSKYGFFNESMNQYYIKGSNKLYDGIDQLYSDLETWGLLYVIREKHGVDYMIKGYVFDDIKYKSRWDTYATLDNDVAVYRTITINQACEFLSVSRPTIYKLIKQGKLPTVNFFGQKRLQVKALLNFISEHTS